MGLCRSFAVRILGGLPVSLEKQIRPPDLASTPRADGPRGWADVVIVRETLHPESGRTPFDRSRNRKSS